MWWSSLPPTSFSTRGSAAIPLWMEGYLAVVRVDGGEPANGQREAGLGVPEIDIHQYGYVATGQRAKNHRVEVGAAAGGGDWAVVPADDETGDPVEQA